ncbi:YciI family protein [Heyndrickxia acidicola]|uniref:YciI family protein n=1 Tax=Heyndrickxia acidicola TaxID=209389 RepID=A0ABU6MGJ8_9BACI|nr:YciI family protein [Heyndrickxia acidicola]MED1203801.1 YciI family protein [Heyndrickxia acidicola]
MELKQYIYTLKLFPALLDEKNWTEREHAVVSRHFEALQKLMEQDKLILAGRTLNMDETTFGIVILQTTTEEEARNLMEQDPAVKEQVMTAELFPYKIALMNERFVKGH